MMQQAMFLGWDSVNSKSRLASLGFDHGQRINAESTKRKICTGYHRFRFEYLTQIESNWCKLYMMLVQYVHDFAMGLTSNTDSRSFINCAVKFELAAARHVKRLVLHNRLVVVWPHLSFETVTLASDKLNASNFSDWHPNENINWRYLAPAKRGSKTHLKYRCRSMKHPSLVLHLGPSLRFLNHLGNVQNNSTQSTLHHIDNFDRIVPINHPFLGTPMT